MSQLLIHDYLGQLDLIKKVSCSQRETIVREAFKYLIKADPAVGSITLDTETTLRSVPPEACAYKLANRCATDRVLDQHKEKKPADLSVREKFDTYRFADQQEKVVGMLQCLTTMRVQTVQITEAMKGVAQ